MKNLNELFRNQENFNAEPIQGPQKVLVICFTPRSGSSLLTELVQSTGKLGYAGEFLNPEFIPKILESCRASNPLDYLIRVLNHTKSRNNVGSIEVTWFHLALFFQSLATDPMTRKMPWPLDASNYFVYLNRENFVAQAISLFKATESGLFHTTQLKGTSGTAYKKLHYDGAKIKQWCEHLLQQEFGFEKWFAAHGVHPLRFKYEDFISNKKLVLTLIGDYVGADVRDKLIQVDEGKTGHKRLSDSLSLEFEERFNAENQEFVTHWKKHRGIQSPFSKRK